LKTLLLAAVLPLLYADDANGRSSAKTLDQSEAITFADPSTDSAARDGEPNPSAEKADSQSSATSEPNGDKTHKQAESNTKILHVDENSSPGAVVGNVGSEREQRKGSYRFEALDGDANQPFAVDQNTGEITVREGFALDFEKISQYRFNVRVANVTSKKGDLRTKFAAKLVESGASRGTVGKFTGSRTVAIRIDVINVNEQPAAQDVVFRLKENAIAGTVVGRVTATDPDADDELSFAIVGGNESKVFEIEKQSGQISVRDGRQLDFEVTPSHTLDIQVTDQTGLRTSIAANVEVEDIAEAPSLPMAADEDSKPLTAVKPIPVARPETITATREENDDDAVVAPIPVANDADRAAAVERGAFDGTFRTVPFPPIDEEPSTAPIENNIEDGVVADVAEAVDENAEAASEPEVVASAPAQDEGVAAVPLPTEAQVEHSSGWYAFWLILFGGVFLFAYLFRRQISREAGVRDAYEQRCQFLEQQVRELAVACEQLEAERDELEEWKREHEHELEAALVAASTKSEDDATEIAGRCCETDSSNLRDSLESLAGSDDQFAADVITGNTDGIDATLRELKVVEDELRAESAAAMTENNAQIDGSKEDTPLQIVSDETMSDDAAIAQFSAMQNGDDECTPMAGDDQQTLQSVAPPLSPSEDNYAVDDATDEDSVNAYMRRILGGDSSYFNKASQPSTTKTKNHSTSTQTAPTVGDADTSSDSAADEPVVETIEATPVPTQPCHAQDKDAVRANVDSLREVAKSSARSAIDTYGRKKQRRIFIVQSALAGVSGVLGIGFVAASQQGTPLSVVGWASVGLSVIMMMGVTRAFVAMKK